MLKFWRVRTCASWRARGHGLSVCCLMTWSLCVLNWVNLWWMDMKISMITWKHKMAPGWRHGWVITLKRGGFWFLIMTKILRKFEDDCWCCSWDITVPNFIQKEEIIITRGNLSCWQIKVICFWYLLCKNLIIFPTFDRFMFGKKVTSHRHNTQIWKIMYCRL